MNTLRETVAAVDLERLELVPIPVDANRRSSMVNRGVAACAIIAVMIQPKVVLGTGTIADVVHLQGIDVFAGSILPVSDAAIVPEASPGEGSAAGARGGP